MLVSPHSPGDLSIESLARASPRPVNTPVNTQASPAPLTPVNTQASPVPVWLPQEVLDFATQLPPTPPYIPPPDHTATPEAPKDGQDGGEHGPMAPPTKKAREETQETLEESPVQETQDTQNCSRN